MTAMTPHALSPDRLFSAEPSQRGVARELYASVKDLPLVCPHGHVDPELLADPDARFGSPADLFIIPDHYVFRMLYSQGVPLEDLGIPTRDGSPVETDHRRIWQRFADHFHLFRGTPTGLWLTDELQSVFGIEEKLTGESAQRSYDQLEEKLARPEYAPRALYERFNIEVLCTTDAATATLDQHRRLRDEGWGNVRPTFRPDAVINDIGSPAWRENVERLGAAAGVDIVDYKSYIRALETRRADFKALGATATDYSTLDADAFDVSAAELARIFDRGLRGEAHEDDALLFLGHMKMELARMSAADGLVTQLHLGSLRNSNRRLFERFGADKGSDIPIRIDWTSLLPLLNEYGNDPRFRLIAFTLDESTFSRELAPLAGHYPAMLLGPPWWFLDSPLGMRRYLDAVVETAGIYNLAGFNDDTRAFASIPVRHDVWRRVTCDWLAGQVVTGVVELADAAAMARALAYDLAKAAYRLDES